MADIRLGSGEGLTRFDPESVPERESYFSFFPDRAATIESIKGRRRVDLVVVGGGIHGAAFARLAAFNGLSTVLFERDDYAFGTSSRSSKMAHGGLRYLELFDFQQVFEGIKAREELFRVAPHLVIPHRFLIPVYSRAYRTKLAVGLTLYDLMLSDRKRRHHWLPKDRLSYTAFSASTPNLLGCYTYTDGILNDTRLVVETIVAARQEGALCLNHAEVTSVHQANDGVTNIGWRDMLSGTLHELACGLVVNCAGPWVPWLGRVAAGELRAQVRYSRGVHLLFSTPWKDPPIFLPMEGKSRYYWVWPHPSGTMVGTTERETEQVDRDPLPYKEEIEEILQRVARDVPQAGLTRESLHYAFAGLRTLPLRSGRSSAQLSRKHIWHYRNGVLSLLGGKLTTASWTAEEGLRRVFSLAGVSRPLTSLKGRLLPGGYDLKESSRRFVERGKALGIDEVLLRRAIRRFGGRVRYFLEDDRFFDPIEGTLLRGEIETALRVEQAESLEDIMRRRLDVEYERGHGLEALDAIAACIAEQRPGLQTDEQCKSYRGRLAAMVELLKA